MSYETKIPDWKEKVIRASKDSMSANEAASILGIKVDTYKKYALKYGCYTTNKSGKGISKVRTKGKIPIDDILEGKHPQYQSNKLRIRLLDEGFFERKCYSCGLESWLGKEIPLELEHIDGNRHNHLLENLNILCPNCHAMTDTYKGKNVRVVE